mgnify:CR=1 FL=1
MKTKIPFIPYQTINYTEEETIKRSHDYYQYMDKRRTVRTFSTKKVPQQVIDNIIMTAGTAPSGAHKQPWMFCVITKDEMRKTIRIAAEKEEYENYHGRMTEEWLADLTVFETDWNKPFIENASHIIVVFKKTYDINQEGGKNKNYYVNESVGIATGFLLAAIHNAGLVALTHTPSPMNFLGKILNRPNNERPFLLIPVGYPAENTTVPNLNRKPKETIIAYYK